MGKVEWETLASAKQKLRDAEKRFERFLMERWPEGSEIHWTKREYIQCGEVMGHSGENVWVQNYSTGKKYWIHCYFIIDRKAPSHGG